MYSPKQWILIDSASQFGLDKKHFSERLAFGREVLSMIQIGEDMSPWIEKADEPEMFAKSILTIQDALIDKPNGHLIGLDAASSGPQILSVLGKCDIGMSNTGALGDEVPDLYTTIYEDMDSEGLTRAQVKKACVPFVYGSQKAPDEVFGEDAPMFVSAYKHTVPTAYAVRELLLAAWDSEALAYTWATPDNHTSHIEVFVTEDIKGQFLNKSYIQRVRLKKAKKKGMSLPAHVTHSYDSFIGRELTGRCGWSHSMVEGIAAIKHHLNHGSIYEAGVDSKELEVLSHEFNFTSIQGFEFIERDCLAGLSDAYLEDLLELGMRCIKYPSFDVRGIHDEFACHANHVTQMQRAYNQILSESYESTWLQSVLKKLTSVDFSGVFPTPDPVITEQLKEAKYAIH